MGPRGERVNTELVFVYGTLRRGGVREITSLVPSARFVDTASLPATLYDLGPYPGIFENDSTRVTRGELYEVPGTTLPALDQIEGCRRDIPADSYYLRSERSVTLDSGLQSTAWVYHCNPDRFAPAVVIESGDWIGYLTERGDGGEDRWPDERGDGRADRVPRW